MFGRETFANLTILMSVSLLRAWLPEFTCALLSPLPALVIGPYMSPSCLVCVFLYACVPRSVRGTCD